MGAGLRTALPAYAAPIASTPSLPCPARSLFFTPADELVLELICHQAGRLTHFCTELDKFPKRVIFSTICRTRIVIGEPAGVSRLGIAAYLAIHLIRLAALYFPLTYFGGLWTGAESKGRHGWIAALLAAVAVVLLFTGIDGIAVLLQRQAPDLLRHELFYAYTGIGDYLFIDLVDLVAMFLGFSLYGRCWRALRLRGKKEWFVALLVSVLLLVIHEAAENQRGVYSSRSPAAIN